MLPLGTKAPAFNLPDTTGKMISLSDFPEALALVVVFMCNHCPYVKHLRAGLAQFARDHLPRGVAIVGINSNDVANYPADSPAKMAEEAKAAGYLFLTFMTKPRRLLKPTGQPARRTSTYSTTTRHLVYRGQFDDSRPGNNLPVSGRDLRSAVDTVLAGKPLSLQQNPSIGCNIKWKPGNEPDYF